MGKRYAIIDIETTGLNARRDKITEIAAVIYEEGEIMNQWSSLINPERTVPEEITRITGISTEMIQDQPKFYEIAKEFLELVEGCLFVAHNVRFDYGFIREEYARLGYSFSMKRLCTLRLSKKTIPGLQSYSLGFLIKHLGIQVQRRHRALDDALATCQLLEFLLHPSPEIESPESLILKKAILESKFPTLMDPDEIANLPDLCGVYYMEDIDGNYLYIGKSTNIRKRIFQHFSKNTRKAEKMRETVARITCRITESELMSLILESIEIKKHQPKINRAQRQTSFPYVLVRAANQNNLPCLSIQKLGVKDKKNKQHVSEHPSVSSAKGTIQRLCDEYELCQCVKPESEIGLSCIHAQLGTCDGAGLKTASEEYNTRFDMAIQSLQGFFHEDMVILEHCSQMGWACFQIEEGDLSKYGYIDRDIDITSYSEFDHHLDTVDQNPELSRIVYAYLDKYNAKLKVIKAQESE